VLADWGADVVKVEPPAGDPQRNVFGAIGVQEQKAVPPFEIDNRGKKSVVINLRSKEGMAQMMSLLETADIFITNLRFAALQRLGIDPPALRQKFPKLVYGIISGFGLEGPDAHRPGYDLGGYWARSGAAHSLVPPGDTLATLRSGLARVIQTPHLRQGVHA
jgi:crotonobetainyl-CoA:carnitine CoA-transferase CaiB-like acyl-CoA transferase